MMNIGCVSVVIPIPGHIVAIECAKGRGLVLPGGKWEKETGETYKEAAARELKEEANLTAKEQQLLYAGFNIDGYFCHSFLTSVSDIEKMKGNDREGDAVLVEIEELISKSAFKAYYEILFDCLKLHMLDEYVFQYVAALESGAPTEQRVQKLVNPTADSRPMRDRSIAEQIEAGGLFKPQPKPPIGSDSKYGNSPAFFE
jgi:8-oxo-dGTP pyrophosphatase MutT (NUDIX family)